MSSRTMSYAERFVPEVPSWLPLLLLVPFVAGGVVDMPRTIRVGSITALGAISVVQLVVATGALMTAGSYPRLILARVAPYALFLVWMIWRSSFEAADQNTVQNGLAYVLFGLEFVLGGTLAAKTPEATVSFLRRGFLILDCVTLSMVLISVLRAGLPSGDVDEGANWLVGPRSVALLAIVPICWHLSGWCHGRAHAGVRALAWTLAVVASLSRTATAVAIVAAAMAFVAHAWVAPRLFVRRAPIVALSAGVLALLLIAFAATFHERFFEGYNNVEVAGVAISTSGRNNIWPAVIASAMTHPLLGGGMGSSQAALWAFDPTVVGHPHNDYLRVWHDGGVIALVLFLLSLFSWLTALGRQWRRSIRTSVAHPEVDFAALLTLVGLMLAMTTDNVVVYTHVMGPSGLLIGAALGLRAYCPSADRVVDHELRVVA